MVKLSFWNVGLSKSLSNQATHRLELAVEVVVVVVVVVYDKSVSSNQ